jgi:hypothetical protein
LTSLSKFALLHDMVDSRKKGFVGLALNSQKTPRIEFSGSRTNRTSQHEEKHA